MENGRRYFIVYFTGQNAKNQQQRGKIHMYVENEGYVNEAYINERITKDFGLDQPFIEKVEELDEADFYDFISDEYPHHKKPQDPSNDFDEFL